MGGGEHDGGWDQGTAAERAAVNENRRLPRELTSRRSFSAHDASRNAWKRQVRGSQISIRSSVMRSYIERRVPNNKIPFIGTRGFMFTLTDLKSVQFTTGAVLFNGDAWKLIALFFYIGKRYVCLIKYIQDSIWTENTAIIEI